MTGPSAPGRRIMNITIQRCSAEKADSFWHALDAVARERRHLVFLQAPPLESTRRFVGQILAKGGCQFYALHDDRVVGWCDILRNEQEGLTHTGRLGMGLLPEYRGLHIGTRLITATIADALGKGMARIELAVFASNTPAIALYRKTGFVEEGRQQRARCLDGIYDDILLLALLKPQAGGSPAPRGSAAARPPPGGA
jgi:RimJ/RimL family protein N-acetyltransferase